MGKRILTLLGGILLGGAVLTSYGCGADTCPSPSSTQGAKEISQGMNLAEEKTPASEKNALPGEGLGNLLGEERPSGTASAGGVNLPGEKNPGGEDSAQGPTAPSSSGLPARKDKPMGEEVDPAGTSSAGTSDQVSGKPSKTGKAKSSSASLSAEKESQSSFSREGPSPGGSVNKQTQGKDQPSSPSAGPKGEVKGSAEKLPPAAKTQEKNLPAEKTQGKQAPKTPSAKPTPIYGLPLEYRFEVPEVPERIRGPTPMPVVSKPKQPTPKELPHRE